MRTTQKHVPLIYSQHLLLSGRHQSRADRESTQWRCSPAIGRCRRVSGAGDAAAAVQRPPHEARGASVWSFDPGTRRPPGCRAATVGACPPPQLYPSANQRRQQLTSHPLHVLAFVLRDQHRYTPYVTVCASRKQ